MNELFVCYRYWWCNSPDYTIETNIVSFDDPVNSRVAIRKLEERLKDMNHGCEVELLSFSRMED